MSKLTTLCYLEQGEDYLLLHRTKKERDENRDKWISVGGKFEDGESPEDCVLREVWEETGLTLTSYRFRGIVTFVSDIYPCEYMHLFTADAWSGRQHPCDEGELDWINKKDFAALPMWEGDRIFLELLETRDTFFSLKLTYRGETLTEAILDGSPLSISANKKI